MRSAGPIVRQPQLSLVRAIHAGGAPQGGPRNVRQFPVDIPTVSLFGEVPAVATRPFAQAPQRHRRAKILGACALTVLVGMGSYAATYRALDLISVPAPANGPVGTAPSGGASTATTPAPVTPVQTQP